jgi:hypothetical protein
MNGDRCYDYALIDFVGDDGSTQSCPSLILGFIRYDITSGIPTPQFIHEQELSLLGIQQNRYIDNSLYMPLFILHQIICHLNNYSTNSCQHLYSEMLWFAYTLWRLNPFGVRWTCSKIMGLLVRKLINCSALYQEVNGGSTLVRGLYKDLMCA